MAPAQIALPRIINPADDVDVVYEQFAFMMEHVENAPHPCGCNECARFLAIRSILFQIFAEPRRTVTVSAANRA